MRLSVHKDDPGYDEWQRLFAENNIDVFLDGVEMKHVETADDQTGYILHCVLDSDGSPQINPDRENEIWTTESFGKVEFKLRPRGIREAATA